MIRLPRILISESGMVHIATLCPFPVWHVLDSQSDRLVAVWNTEADAQWEANFLQARRGPYQRRRLRIVRSVWDIAEGVAPVGIVADALAIRRGLMTPEELERWAESAWPPRSTLADLASSGVNG